MEADKANKLMEALIAGIARAMGRISDPADFVLEQALTQLAKNERLVMLIQLPDGFEGYIGILPKGPVVPPTTPDVESTTPTKTVDKKFH